MPVYIAPPIPRDQCWREISSVALRRDLLQRVNFESRGEGVFINCFRAPSHVPTPAIICKRIARFCRQGLGETIVGCDGYGHGDDDGDGQLRLARQSRNVRRVPEVRLCQMHCVRDASQVRQVRQVARWARPHLLLRPSNARTPKSTLGRHGYGAPPLHENAVKLVKLT